MTTDPRVQRLHALLYAAEKLADPRSPEGQKARALLTQSSGLSAAGVDYALTHCLEHRAGRATISQLTKMAKAAPRAHVLLSANVFTASFRAIALGLAQSSQVFVRPSRREPEMARLLHQVSGGAFELVDSLSPAPGDHLWAYGSDTTLQELRSTLPAGIHFHGHGAGLGVAVIAAAGLRRDQRIEEIADALAQDTLAFDQRGCLSPRIVLLVGEAEFAANFTEALAAALDRAEARIPRGVLSEEEQAEAERYETTMTYVGGHVRAGKAIIVLDPEPERLYVPPIGRYLHLSRTEDPLGALQKLGPRLTSVALFGAPSLSGKIHDSIGPRRVVELGRMQTPPLDGPVDLRAGWNAELL